MSLRDLAAPTNVSNPYLSQLERGLHEPSVRVLKAIATALNMSAEALMVQAGLLDGRGRRRRLTVGRDAVQADPGLSDEQKAALLAVYRSYVEARQRRQGRHERAPDATSRPAEGGPGGSSIRTGGAGAPPVRRPSWSPWRSAAWPWGRGAHQRGDGRGDGLDQVVLRREQGGDELVLRVEDLAGVGRVDG